MCHACCVCAGVLRDSAASVSVAVADVVCIRTCPALLDVNHVSSVHRFRADADSDVVNNERINKVEPSRSGNSACGGGGIQ